MSDRDSSSWALHSSSAEILRDASRKVLPQIILGDRWGPKSWHVWTNVRFNKLRGYPPHVELRANIAAPEPECTIGARYVLRNLHRYTRGGIQTPAIVWEFVGLEVAGTWPPRAAHLTVEHGWEYAVEDYAEWSPTLTRNLST